MVFFRKWRFHSTPSSQRLLGIQYQHTVLLILPPASETPAAAAHFKCKWPLQWKNMNYIWEATAAWNSPDLCYLCVFHISWLLLQPSYESFSAWASRITGQRPSWPLKYILLHQHIKIFKLSSLRLSTWWVSSVEITSRNYSFCCHLYYLGRCFFLKIFCMVGLSGCPYRDYEMPLER